MIDARCVFPCTVRRWESQAWATSSRNRRNFASAIASSRSISNSSTFSCTVASNAFCVMRRATIAAIELRVCPIRGGAGGGGGSVCGSTCRCGGGAELGDTPSIGIKIVRIAWLVMDVGRALCLVMSQRAPQTSFVSEISPGVLACLKPMNRLGFSPPEPERPRPEEPERPTGETPPLGGVSAGARETKTGARDTKRREGPSGQPERPGETPRGR